MEGQRGVTPVRRPIGAEARGKRRVLRQQLAQSAARLRETYRSKRARSLVEAWAYKRGKGRARAQQHLVALFGPTARPWLTGDGFLGFLFFAPSGRIVAEDDPDDPGLGQDCIAANALLAGVLPGRAPDDVSIASCHWNMEFSDHAVGRLIERSPRASPVEVMAQAHHAAMRTGFHLPIATFWPEFWLPSRDWGAFACQPIIGELFDPPGKTVLHIRARTWLDVDQLTDQFLITEAPQGFRFGASILMPGPLITQEWSDLIRQTFPKADTEAP